MKPLRTVIILLLINLGLACTFLLPSSPEIKPSAIIMDLPKNLNLWQGYAKDPSKREIEILGSDTKFEQKVYYQIKSFINKKVDLLEASIVLSGHDMNRSIHRAERCLNAQGFTIEKHDLLKIPINNNKDITVKKIISSILHNEKKMHKALYYWFVGHDTITHDHYTRTFTDMKDRVIKGYDQQWGYISIIIDLSDLKLKNGFTKESYTINESDAIVSSFIKNIFNKIHSIKQLKKFSDDKSEKKVSELTYIKKK